MLQLTQEEVKKRIDEGDLEVINAVIDHSVSIVQPEQNQSQEQISPISSEGSTENTPIKQENENTEVTVPIVDEYQQEIDRKEKYNEFLEQQRQEEHEKYLFELKEKESLLLKEKQAKEELEQRLRQLEELNQSRSPTHMDTDKPDDEDEYASEYTKRTRAMVEELKTQVGVNNPVVKQLTDKIEFLEQNYNSEKEERKRFEDHKRKKDSEEKLYNNIRQFQTKAPELKTKRDIVEIHNDYTKFRKDIAYVSNAKTVKELEDAIKDYHGGGQIKQLADKVGIKPVEELDKYDQIVDLIDMKEGLRYDSVLGKHTPILDEMGQQVRYRSLDEAYKIKNFEKEIQRVRTQSFRDVSKKLETLNTAAVTLKPEQTDTFSTGLSIDQEKEILSWEPKDWANNAEKRRLVELVYSKRGLEMPRYRGRRL